MKFVDKAELNLHYKTAHEVQKPLVKHTIRIRKKPISSGPQLNKSVPNAKFGKFECGICYSCYKSKDTFLSHIASAHEGILQCGLCEMRFELNITDLHDHYHQFHKGSEQFENSQIFVKHGTGDVQIGIILPGSSPFKCHVCDQGFKHIAALTYHHTTAHDSNKSKERNVS